MTGAGVGSQTEFGAARWQPSPRPQVSAAHLKESCTMPSALNDPKPAPPCSAAKPAPCPRAGLRERRCLNSWQLLGAPVCLPMLMARSGVLVLTVVLVS